MCMITEHNGIFFSFLLFYEHNTNTNNKSEIWQIQICEQNPKQNHTSQRSNVLFAKSSKQADK